VLTSRRVPHNRLTFGKTELAAVTRVIQSGYWAGRKVVAQLETSLAAKAGVAHGAAVGSGLAALRLALLGLGVGTGDEVIVPGYSCVAVANAVLSLGAYPRIGDVQPDNWNLDPTAVRQNLTRKTRAIIAVNTFGVPALTEEMVALGVPVIEDCAHAFGMRADKARLGARGRAAVLSFYATKLMGAGEGGAVLTNDQALGDFVRAWRDYGDKAPDRSRLNDKMTNVEAALALCQLRRLDTMIRLRQRLAERYHEKLAPLSARTGTFRLPNAACRRVWYRYVVEIRGRGLRRVVSAMRAHGIQADLPVEAWFRTSVEASTVPNAAHAYAHLLSLPLFPTLTKKEQDRVCHVFARVIKEVEHDEKQRDS
jgi:perosamine synthetase